MCHSVDMYMPEASRRAAEERILEGRAAGAAREQWVVDTVFGFAARLRRWLGRWRGIGLGRAPAEGMTQERIEHG